MMPIRLDSSYHRCIRRTVVTFETPASAGRRWVGLTIAVAIAVLALAIAWPHPRGARAHSAARRAGRPAQPNIVLILTDDERFDTLSRMPNVERLLASHGVTFTNAFVTTSECCPSRASILSGQYSHDTGVLQNFGPAGYKSFDEHSSVATWLHRAGYDTSLVGKYLNDYTYYGHHHIAPGWSDWQVIDSRPEERYYGYRINDDGRLLNYGAAAKDYSTDVLGARAVSFIGRARPPFFLYFAPIAPHLPAIPAPPDLEKPLVLPKPRPDFDEGDIRDKPWHDLYRRVLKPQAVHFLDREIEGQQLLSLRDVDRQVGSIMAALKRRRVLDDTVVVFMSDNGFLWGEHRLGGKLWPYEESIRVPLVIRAPWIHKPRIDRHLVLNIDLASTFAQLAGVRPGLPQDGRSLVPLLHGESPRWRDEFLEEYMGESTLSDAGPPPFQAVRTKHWMYVEYLNGWRELYDLEHDPYELANREHDPRYATVRRHLVKRLHDLADG
jgi:arylsulfatase A-like enzyme